MSLHAKQNTRCWIDNKDESWFLHSQSSQFNGVPNNEPALFREEHVIKWRCLQGTLVTVSNEKTEKIFSKGCCLKEHFPVELSFEFQSSMAQELTRDVKEHDRKAWQRNFFTYRLDWRMGGRNIWKMLFYIIQVKDRTWPWMDLEN